MLGCVQFAIGGSPGIRFAPSANKARIPTGLRFKPGHSHGLLWNNSKVLLTNPRQQKNTERCFLVARPGFEPGTPWLKVKCSTDWASEPHGRGGRIWTYGCKSQSLVPYHLATPLCRWWCFLTPLGWGGRIRTYAMLESESNALPLGDTPSKICGVI